MGRWLILLAAVLWVPPAPAESTADSTGMAAPTAAAARGPIPVQDLAAFVDGFVQARMKSHHVVGVTVSVVHGGEMIFSRGYGFADLAAQRPVQADRTLFRPGSISKTFTWTAVMQLYEQGRLDLDADIRTYLPNLEIAADIGGPITLKHLMAHTPGYEESVVGHLFGNDPDDVPSLLGYLRSHAPARVRAPGTLPAYSNYGVAVAGQIVANVSGMPWEIYAQRHLFEPLGMTRSTFREPWNAAEPAPMPAELREDVSEGYVHRAGGYRAGSFTFISQVGPAGALSTTATDMARWMLAHLNHGQLDGAGILAPETARLMHSQHYTVHPLMPGMAHGFIESRMHGYRAIGHGGGTIYFTSDMQLVPAQDLGVFISTNTSGGGELIREFVRTLVARYFPPGPHVPAEAVRGEPVRPLAEYAGTYLSTRRPFTTVERLFMTNAAQVAASPDGYLVAAAPGMETRLEPLGGDTFRSADTGDLVTFTAGEDGEVNAMLLPIPVMVMQKAGLLETPAVLYGILTLAALVLAGAVIGAWLRRRRPPAQTAAEAWAGRIAVLTAVVWVCTYAAGMLGLGALASDISRAFFEFPSSAFLAALSLALVAAVLTLVSAVLLYPVWSRRNWPLWRRVRHTGVVAAAMATLLVLYDFNAIGFNFFGG